MTILQQEVTLDQAVLGGVKTFPNGCNFAVYFDERGQPWLDYGCYGVHINLCGGHERLLYQWFKGILEEPVVKLKTMLKMIDGKVPLDVSPETVYELKKRDPCERCGSPFFKPLCPSK